MDSDPPDALNERARLRGFVRVHGGPQTERDAARGSVEGKKQVDPELKRELDEAVRLAHQLDDKKETHRHREVGFDKLIELAPVIIAAIVVLLGFGVFIGAMVAASWYGSHADFWAKQGERGIGTAIAALAYIFGKSTK
jgi:hypothetical protein